MTTITEHEFIESGRRFLEERLGGGTEIGADTELLDSGLVDSLLVLEFFFFLESVRGEEIVPDAASMAAIATLRSAYKLVVA